MIDHSHALGIVYEALSYSVDVLQLDHKFHYYYFTARSSQTNYAINYCIKLLLE